MTAYAKPYFAAMRMNLHDHIAKGLRINEQGQSMPAQGRQKPSLSVDIDLYLGPKNVGSQPYSFFEKNQPASASNSGLPAYSDVLSQEIIDVWIAAFDSAIDAEFPAYFDESEEAKAAGPVLYPRVNRIEASFPADRPAERYIGAIIGLYEDKEYSRQIINSDFVVLFNQDAAINLAARRQFGLPPEQELAPEIISKIRSDNMQYPLKDFVSNPAMAQSIGVLAASVFTVLKSQVFQWADIDVATIMKNFSIPVD